MTTISPDRKNLPAVPTLNRLKRFLTARSTVIAIIGLLTAALTIAAVVPQKNAAVGGLSLGFNHVFTTWWFVALALLFLSSLVLSTVDQFRLTLARVRRPAFPGRTSDEVPARTMEELDRLLPPAGYRRVCRSDNAAIYVKGNFGNWGGFLLHLGMTVTVLFSLVYVLTEHRVIVRLIAGEPVMIGQAATTTRRGLLAGDLPLPEALTLITMRPTFWENDQLRGLESDLVFTSSGSSPRNLRLGINDKQSWHGLTLYQRNVFGTAFLIEYVKEGRPAQAVLQLSWPMKRTEAGYGETTLDDGFRLKAKYYRDAGKSTLLSNDPLLILRLYDGEQFAAELPLRIGSSGRLGDYTIRLVGTSWWTEFLFEGSRGTAGIFAGFFLLLLGGVVAYFIAPREIVVWETPDGNRISWRAKRFTEFYREEGQEILTRCRRHDD